MIQSLLRQHRAFIHFTTDHASPHKDKFASIKFDDTTWTYIQEMEAIMSSMGVVNMGTQTDQPGFISYCWYQIQYVWSTAEKGEMFSVMNFKKTWSPETPVHKIPTELRARKDLLPQSLEFQHRIVRECDLYVPDPDSDMRLSILFNPVSTKLCLRYDIIFVFLFFFLFLLLLWKHSMCVCLFAHNPKCHLL
jgi:hypothetical protein